MRERSPIMLPEQIHPREKRDCKHLSAIANPNPFSCEGADTLRRLAVEEGWFGHKRRGIWGGGFRIMDGWLNAFGPT